MKRSGRFGDHGELLRDRRDQMTYFAGRFGAARMDLVRKSIETVRGNWRAQDRVPESIYSFVKDINLSCPDIAFGRLMAPIEQSFDLNRDWADRAAALEARTTFPLIHHYTTDFAYDALFREINRRYRSDADTRDEQRFVVLTWLIELLNMELFAASHADPTLTGNRTVYRGTVFPSALRARYEVFASSETAIEDRAISIPLGLHSSSTTPHVARAFIGQNLSASAGDGHFGVVWNIHVVSLSTARLSRYRHYYPDSVVSPICAIDISRFSAFGGEGEVLLRGPFFEVLDCRPDDEAGKHPVMRLDAVMLDSNRDHISTFELDKRDQDARILFRQLVAAQKFEVCATIAAELGKATLAAHYRDAAGSAEEDVVAICARLDRRR